MGAVGWPYGMGVALWGPYWCPCRMGVPMGSLYGVTHWVPLSPPSWGQWLPAQAWAVPMGSLWVSLWDGCPYGVPMGSLYGVTHWVPLSPPAGGSGSQPRAARALPASFPSASAWSRPGGCGTTRPPTTPLSSAPTAPRWRAGGASGGCGAIGASRAPQMWGFAGCAPASKPRSEPRTTPGSTAPCCCAATDRRPRGSAPRPRVPHIHPTAPHSPPYPSVSTDTHPI